jgi:fatty acid desaturase
VLAVGFQVAVYFAVGCSLGKYLFASPIALACTSSIATGYIWTNHFIRPFNAQYHPLLSSTSVRVPALLDWLHSNFSYHSEHHLFPSLRSRHYPDVSRALSGTYQHVYQRVGFGEAWTILLSGAGVLDDSAEASRRAEGPEPSVLEAEDVPKHRL